MPETDCPIEEDATLQRRTWAIQRVSWVILAIIPLLALSGLFSGGPLSTRSVGESATFTIRYERFQRVTRVARFVVRVAPGRPDELRLGQAFQRTYEIERIDPQPVRGTGGDDGLSLGFDPPADGPLTITISVRPRRFGEIEMVAQNGVTPVSFRVLIYP